jgi:hypothetical protein
MTPYNMRDDTGKLGEAPDYGSPVKDFADFVGRGYGVPDGYRVVRIVRHGGRAGTGLTVFIEPPGGGDPIRIVYEKESDCWNHNKLRARAVADTRGLTRGQLISGPKAAHAMYEALCSMADHFEAADLEGQTWEWCQQLDRVAARTTGTIDSFRSVKRLQLHDYSKKLVQDPPTDEEGRSLVVVPLLLADERDGYLYITARHMAVFLRYDLGVQDAGSDDQIITRLKQIGGERVPVQVWDRTGRNRDDKVRLVLYRLPEDTTEEEE